MSVTTVWTHGNALQVEDPGEYADIRHRGWGTVLHFAGPRDDENGASLSPRISHIPLNTPPAIDGIPPTLVKLVVLYETQGYCFLNGIVVWDANNQVTQIDTGESAGSFLTLAPQNQFTLGEFPIATALSIDFVCQPIFLPADQPGGPNTDPEFFTLAAVGAEFLYKEPFATRPGSVRTHAKFPNVPKAGG